MFYRESGVFKTTYATDMALYPLPITKWAVAAVAVLFIVVAPLTLGEYLISILNLILIASVGALGLNILVGYTGQVSIGHAAFMSVGAYTAANLIVRLGAPFWIAVPAGGLMAALIGAIVGIPSLRIKGLYLAIATLAAQLIIEWTINHVSWISGGVQASIEVPRPSVFGIVLKSQTQLYFFLMFFLVLAIVAMQNIVRGRIGRAFVAVRDHDTAAEIIGINIFRYKLLAFAISSFYAGVTGVLYSYYLGLDQYHYPAPYFDARNRPPNFRTERAPHRIASERQRHAGLLVPPDAEVQHAVQPHLREQQLPFMDQQPCVHHFGFHRFQNFIKRRHYRLEVRLK